MSKQSGKNNWYFPDLFWPEGEGPSYVSHEAICILNSSKNDATLSITLYYENAEPLHLPEVICKAGRTNHIRMDQIRTAEGNLLPRNVGYAASVESDTPVVAQYTRVDLSQGNLALMTCLGYGE